MTSKANVYPHNTAAPTNGEKVKGVPPVVAFNSRPPMTAGQKRFTAFCIDDGSASAMRGNTSRMTA
jgi:hypothetical protein